MEKLLLPLTHITTIIMIERPMPTNERIMPTRASGFFAPHFALEIIPNTAPGTPNRIPHPQHPKTTEMIPQTREMMLNTFAAPVGPSAGAAL